MNNLGAALLQKQKQNTSAPSVDLVAIQQKINAERQQLLDTINTLKAENEFLKAENESLKSENIKKTPLQFKINDAKFISTNLK
jgi:cell division protein FtsB